MISYRDMTFCKHWETCAKAKHCDRPLTDEVREAAKQWWGGDGAPIAVFTDTPSCHIDTRQQALNELTRLGQEMGDYDND